MTNRKARCPLCRPHQPKVECTGERPGAIRTPQGNHGCSSASNGSCLPSTRLIGVPHRASSPNDALPNRPAYHAFIEGTERAVAGVNACQRLQLTSASAFPLVKSSGKIGVPWRTMARIAIALRIALLTPDGRIFQRGISARGYRRGTSSGPSRSPTPQPWFQSDPFLTVSSRFVPCSSNPRATENVIPRDRRGLSPHSTNGATLYARTNNSTARHRVSQSVNS